MDKDKDAATGITIQDQYLARVRKDRAWLTVHLNNGKKIGGRVVSFDRYTLILEDHGNEQMVFKHAIATITASRSFANTLDLRPARSGRERPAQGPEAGAEGAAGGGGTVPGSAEGGAGDAKPRDPDAAN